MPQDLVVSSTLLDQQARDAFTTKLGENFSVIAGAGAGKTRAIVERVVALALQDRYATNAVLPRLVVVTYTRKAAEEMEQRVRQNLLSSPETSDCLASVNKAFFGTIHSFCLDLLYRFGPLAGLPSGLELVEQEDVLWLAFVRSLTSLDEFLPAAVKKEASQLLHLNTLLEAAKSLRPDSLEAFIALALPEIEWSRLLNFEADKRNQNAIDEGKQYLNDWLDAFAAGELSLGFPAYEKGGKAFQVCWAEVLKPLQDWAGGVALVFIKNVARAYAEFRLSKGLVRYDDMVRLALGLMKDPAARKEIAKQGYHVILDEAQDTDEDQFTLLLELARPEQAQSFWLNSKEHPPESGRFCMVGDPQQSIYGSRADVATYLRFHHALLEYGAAEALNFSVTMRCDEALVDSVNALFPSLFESSNNIDFTPLQKRPWAGSGQVLKLPLAYPKDQGFEALLSEDKARAEARALVDWLASQSLDSLGLTDWSELAFIAPRKKWLLPLDQAFREAGVKAQVHSHELQQGDCPAYAWLTALVTVVAQPQNAFEIAGVLREVFGVSDHDTACFVKERGVSETAGHPLQILELTSGEGPVVAVLNNLCQIRQTVLALPWVEAVYTLAQLTGLSERLNSLPGYTPGSLVEALELHLFKAIEKETTSFQDWASALQSAYAHPQDEVPVSPGCVQLYTCHKSKGLEWKLVVVPFLFRDISKPPTAYPKLLRAEAGASPTVLLDKNHRGSLLESAQAKRVYEEHKRLLYVTLTRARQRLILVDDSSLFYSRKGHSFADTLQITPEGRNESFWENLDTSLVSLEGLSERETDCLDLSWLNSVSHDEEKMPEALQRASLFPERVIPSSLARHEASEVDDPGRQLQSGGADYGNWWHLMMEENPWDKDMPAWKTHCLSTLEQCPYPERGEVEILSFLASDCAQYLAQPSVSVRTEVPFMWPSDNGIIYEGSIDLVAWSADTQSAWVLDWKTDALSPEALLEAYQPQINVYCQAVSSFFGVQPQAQLYSTRLGTSIKGR